MSKKASPTILMKRKITDLEQKLAIAREALEKIEDVTSAMSTVPNERRGSYADWELRRIAGEALEKIGDGK